MHYLHNKTIKNTKYLPSCVLQVWAFHPEGNNQTTPAGRNYSGIHFLADRLRHLINNMFGHAWPAVMTHNVWKLMADYSLNDILITSHNQPTPAFRFIHTLWGWNTPSLCCIPWLLTITDPVNSWDNVQWTVSNAAVFHSRRAAVVLNVMYSD